MDFEEALSVIENLSSSSHPHGSNLKQKLLNSKSGKSKSGDFVCEAIQIFSEILLKFDRSVGSIDDYELFIDQIDQYISKLRSDAKGLFSHQSDFVSSVIPELYCQIFKKKLSQLGENDFIVSGQLDLTIDFQFLNNQREPILFKTKRVDVAVYRPITLTVLEKEYEFIVPVIAVENKVNLDKNMLYGIINTANSIKKMFPNCHYLACTEFSDLTLSDHNYAYSDIDQVYTLRKQKRGDFRRTKIAKQISKPLVLESIELLADNVKTFNSNAPDLEALMVSHGRLII